MSDVEAEAAEAVETAVTPAAGILATVTMLARRCQVISPAPTTTTTTTTTHHFGCGIWFGEYCIAVSALHLEG